MRSPERNRFLIALTLISGLIGIGGYMIEGKPPGTDRYYLTNSGGSVLFEHNSHLNSTVECERCHHELLSSDQRYDCGECHDEDMVADDFEHVDLKAIEAHTCGTCHRVEGSAEAQSCRECHPSVQESERLTTACDECHDPGYTPDVLTHGEMEEVHARDCQGCHNPGSVSGAYHQQCSRCHLAENSALFAAADGNPRCERCHLK